MQDSHPYGSHRLWTDTAGRTYTFHLDATATGMDAMLDGVVIVRGAPADFRAAINPVFDGDYVWAVTRDELDVQRVVRYRIVWE